MGKRESENSYKSILKGTSAFGGVQLLQVLINLVRGKFVAMFLGPEGMGIASLFTGSSNTIQRFSSLGLNLAIVKEVSSNSDDKTAFSHTMAVARKLITFTSLFGALVCVLFCVPLSRASFGTSDMAWQFVLLGPAVGLAVAGAGRLALLQGMHEVKRLSKASVVGGLCGLFVGVPLYYFFGDKGIVPAMVALSLTMYIFYSLSLRKSVEGLDKGVKFSWQSHKPLVKRLVSLGLILMASDLIGTAMNYLLSIFIRVHSDYDTLGFYTAANTVTNQYAGMVFAAMAMDYLPRLSKAAADNTAMRTVVNRQTEIVALIIAPAICLLILTAPIVIRLLLTEEYRCVLPLMRWLGLGVLMKALAYPLGYISFAKGNKKLFFWLEGITGNCLTLLLSCIFFYFFGLMGLGYALVADNAICLLIYYFVNRRLYGYRFSGASLRHLFIAMAFGGSCFAASLCRAEVPSYVMMGMVFAVAMVFGILSLRKKLSAARE